MSDPDDDYIPDRGLDDNWPEPVPEPASIWLKGRKPVKQMTAPIAPHMQRVQLPYRRSQSTPPLKPFTTTPEEQASLKLPPFLDRKLTGGTPEGIEREWQKWKLLQPKPQEN